MVGQDLGIVWRGYQRRWLGLIVALLPSLAAAQHLPGLGQNDPRVMVDIGHPPWSSVVRLQIPGVSVCTAFLVGPVVALTAAHCLYGGRLGHFAPAASVHLLSGYANGAFAQHVLVQSYRIASGYDPRAPDATRGADAAVLILTAPFAAATASLPINAIAPPDGTVLVLAGFSQDRTQRLQIDPDCHATGLIVDPGGTAMLRHSCAGTRGTSGGPLLHRDAAGIWQIVGLQSGAHKQGRGGLAVTGTTLRGLLN